MPVLAALSLCVAHISRADTLQSSEPLQPWSIPALPDLSLTDLDGATHDLARYRGRPVIVHFFATWCEPCREELSALDDWHGGTRTGHAVLAINVAEVPARVRAFLTSDPVAYPVLLDTARDATKAWGVSTLPTTFLIDANHNARLKVVGPLDWAQPRVRATLNHLAADAAPAAQPKATE